jgi:hypothetical protein
MTKITYIDCFGWEWLTTHAYFHDLFLFLNQNFSEAMCTHFVANSIECTVNFPFSKVMHYIFTPFLVKAKKYGRDWRLIVHDNISAGKPLYCVKSICLLGVEATIVKGLCCCMCGKPLSRPQFSIEMLVLIPTREW